MKLGAFLLATGIVLAGTSTDAKAQSDSAAREELRQIVTTALREHTNQEALITRLWGYATLDGAMLFCGVAADQTAGARGRYHSNFVLAVSASRHPTWHWQTHTDIMEQQGCGRSEGRTDLIHPEVNGSLRDLIIYDPPLPETPRVETSHIPKDAYGNILVTAADRQSPRCSAGAEYAYRSLVLHERNVIQNSGEPVANFNDYTQPFGRCFNRTGQAIMQGVLERAQLASDQLWLQNELRSLRLRLGSR